MRIKMLTMVFVFAFSMFCFYAQEKDKNDYAETVNAAEKSIETYKSDLMRELARKQLQRIVNSKLTEEEKIKRIQMEFSLNVENQSESSQKDSPNKILILPGDAVKIELVYVKAGTFTMAHRDGKNYKEEKKHQVTLTKDFWIGKTEVTQLQWKTVMGYNPSRFKGGDTYPVEQVNWNDIQSFLKTLNELYAEKLPPGYTIGLPTEAQWEYAAQGGHKRSKYTKFAGSDVLDDVGWYDDNSDDHTHPVAQKVPNELGLYDMNGNVWERCSDFSGNYGGNTVDPTGALKSDFRITRGGSWKNDDRCCRNAYRDPWIIPEAWYNDGGFRIALIPIQ